MLVPSSKRRFVPLGTSATRDIHGIFLLSRRTDLQFWRPCAREQFDASRTENIECPIDIHRPSQIV
jgi:hypothetical protein